MERPKWKPKRGATGAQSARGGRQNTAAAQAAKGALSARDCWPPPNTQAIEVSIISAGGLPRADRSVKNIIMEGLSCILSENEYGPKPLIKTFIGCIYVKKC